MRTYLKLKWKEKNFLEKYVTFVFHIFITLI